VKGRERKNRKPLFEQLLWGLLQSGGSFLDIATHEEIIHQVPSVGLDVTLMMSRAGKILSELDGATC
jgi:hypothetical protein